MRTSSKRAAANRRNALKSTGPKTTEGKAVAAMNALKHGLRASDLAVPYLETSMDWETHLAQTVRTLAPVGYLETVLAERAASILWRMGRAVRYESLTVAAAMETAEERCFQGSYGERRDGVKELQDKVDQARAEVDVFAGLRTAKAGTKIDPETAWEMVQDVAKFRSVELWEEVIKDSDEWTSTIDLSEIPDGFEVDEWDGWTAGLLRTVIGRVAEKRGETFDQVLDMMAASRGDKVKELEAKLQEAKVDLERWRKTHLLPDEETLDKVARYESSLERSLFRTLHELERIQAARSGEHVPLPAVADVAVSMER